MGLPSTRSSGFSAKPDRASYLLRRQTNTAGADQTRIGRLEAPECSARCPLEIDVLIIGPAKSEVGCCGVAIRNRHEAEDQTARIDFHDAAERRHAGPHIALDVVMDAVRAAIAGDIGAGLNPGKGQ